MTKQFNPFHEWLGFDESVTKPHHFQLLGVKTMIEDPIGFRKKVHTQAKKLLNQLEAMSDEQIGSRTKLHTRLRKHIVKAHDILQDDQQRKAYLKTIRAKSRLHKDSKPLESTAPLIPSPSQLASAKKSSSAKKPSAPEPQKTEAKTDQTVIPMAIPLQREIEAEIEESSSETSPPNIAVQYQKRTSTINKRKRSLIVPILCVLMLLLSVAGLIYIVAVNLKAF
jgi:hypothetical protein